MDTQSGGKMHVLMVPWLALGHILPFTEFAKRVARQGHRVTLLSTTNNTRRLIDIPPALACLIRVVDIPLPRVDGLPEHAEATIDLPSYALGPYLRRAYDTAFEHELSRLLQEEEARPDWVLVDYAAYWAPAAAAMHGVPCAFLSLFGPAALSFFGKPEGFLGLGEHARTKPADFTVVPKYVPFPTTVAYRGYEARELFEPGIAPDNSGVSEGYRFAKSIQGSKLVGIRSSTQLEPEWLRLLGELYQKPVIPVGFFPPAPQQDVTGHEATISWLDKQAPSSVVYAAFGSEVKLTSAQLQRIALGLEASGLPFIWAFRPPTDATTASGDGLPGGFEERIDSRGVLCRGWVPQVRFLCHASVGGFLTHGGWNSVAEGLAQGVKLVLLPLVFDQGLNARNLVDKKIGVEVARDEQDGSFAPQDIAVALRRVMVGCQGEEFGAKVKELAQVLGDDEVNDQCVRDFLTHLSEYNRNTSTRALTLD